MKVLQLTGYFLSEKAASIYLTEQSLMLVVKHSDSVGS